MPTLVELPGDIDPASVQGRERLEDSRADVDVAGGTRGAQVDDPGGGGLAVVVDGGHLVAATAAGVDGRADGSNGVVVVVGLAAGAEARVEVGHLAAVAGALVDGGGAAEGGGREDGELGEHHFEDWSGFLGWCIVIIAKS